MCFEKIWLKKLPHPLFLLPPMDKIQKEQILNHDGILQHFIHTMAGQGGPQGEARRGLLGTVGQGPSH